MKSGLDHPNLGQRIGDKGIFAYSADRDDYQCGGGRCFAEDTLYKARTSGHISVFSFSGLATTLAIHTLSVSFPDHVSSSRGLRRLHSRRSLRASLRLHDPTGLSASLDDP